MAETKTNDQVIDSVSTSSALCLDYAPPMALGMFLQSVVQALSNSVHNSITAQQQMNITSQTAAGMGVSLIHSLGSAVKGK